MSTKQGCKALVYGQYGNPTQVLQLIQNHSSLANSLNATQSSTNSLVHIKLLAANINPSDINQIEGVYPARYNLPSVGGNEGVGEVMNNFNDFKIGDRVGIYGQGVWRESEIFSPPESLCKMSSKIDPLISCTLLVNPLTAYLMLQEETREGDLIIQNGANSSVGVSLIQIAKKKLIKTINVIRGERQDYQKVKKELEEIGADLVIKSEDLSKPETVELIKNTFNGMMPRIGFDCVAGQVGTEMAKLISDNGTMINYGVMSKQPLKIAGSSLIFRNLVLKGFWVSQWRETHGKDEKEKAIRYIEEMILNGELVVKPTTSYKLDQWSEALEEARKPFKDRKIVFKLSDY